MTSDNDLRRAAHINAKKQVPSEARAALRENVARAICREKCAFLGEPPCFTILDDSPFRFPPETCCEPGCVAEADAAIAVVLEEAAKVAEKNAAEAWTEGAEETRGLMRLQAADIAAAIRGVITSPESAAPDADQSSAIR